MGSNIPKIGNTDIVGCYIANTEISKMYIGDTLIYDSSSSEELWDILDGGATLERLVFPYTIPSSGGTSSPQTASTDLSISGIALNATATTVLDGATLTDGTSCNYRDCTTILTTQNNGLAFNYTGNYPSIQADSYIKLNKDGTVKEIVSEPEEYSGTYPDNFLLYDSVNDTITVKAGDYDSSIYSNTPCTISSDITLNNMGGMYADDDFKYTYNLDTPTLSIGLCNNTSSYISDVSIKKGTSNDPNIKMLRIGFVQYYDTGQAFTTSYATYSPAEGFSAPTIFMSSSGNGSISSGQSLDVVCTIDQQALNEYATINDSYTWTFSLGVNRASGGGIQVYFTDNNDVESLMTTVGQNTRPEFSLTPTQIKAIKKVRIHYTFSSSATAYTISVNPSIVGTRTADYSKKVSIETRQDWGEPTKGMLEIGYGNPTNLYVNVANSTLVSFTNQPLYEVISS